MGPVLAVGRRRCRLQSLGLGTVEEEVKVLEVRWGRMGRIVVCARAEEGETACNDRGALREGRRGALEDRHGECQAEDENGERDDGRGSARGLRAGLRAVQAAPHHHVV